MTLIEERLKAMLRGRLPEAERQELESWYLQSDSGDEPAVVETLENIEREVLEAWNAGELVPAEATAVLRWQTAHYCRLLAASVALRQRAVAALSDPPRPSPWVM